MTFKQWVRDLFGPESRAQRASRRGKSRRPSRRGYKPLVESLEDRRLLAVLTVNSLLDNTPSGDGLLTLREAIKSINQESLVDSSTSGQLTGSFGSNDTIQFGSSIDGGTIGLTSFINDATVAGPSAFLINHTMTLDGETGLNQGITISRSGSTPFRFFDIEDPGNLTLKGLTLSGGKAQGGDGGSSLLGGTGGGAAGLGGAIFNQGTLTIQDSTLSGNTAQGGNGAAFQHPPATRRGGGGGGGLGGPGTPSQGGGESYQLYAGSGGGPHGGSPGTSYSYPNGNSATGFGGGGGGGLSVLKAGNGGNGGFGGGGGGAGYAIYSQYIEYYGVKVFYVGGVGGNGGFGGGGGGGPRNNQSGLVGYVFDDKFYPGSGGFGGGTGVKDFGGGGAGMGGAVFSRNGSVVITNSTFYNNTANGGGGGNGVGKAGQGLGGGLFNYNGKLTVTNSTFSENTAAQSGRGVYILGLGASTATVDINNTIIGQEDTTGADLGVAVTAGGKVALNGQANLIRNSTIPTTTDITNNLTALNTDPELKPLDYNGGWTLTMGLQSDSPAIDASAISAATTADQRGALAVGTRDIGAFEFGAVIAQTINFGSLADKTYGDADFPISAKATSRLAVSFTASGNASVYQDMGGAWFVHIIGAGSATITAHQAGSDIFSAAADVAQSLTIDKANATVVVTPYTVIYDGLPHTATVTSIVGVNGDTGTTVGTVNVTGTTHTIAETYPSDFWTFKGTANYNDISNTSITDTIALALSALPIYLTVNSPYTMAVTAAGRPGSSTFTLVSGTLPTGITLNANGTFRGAPTAIGQFTFTIAATNATATGSRTYTININAPPTIGDLTVTQWTARYAGFTGTMTIANGSPTYAIVGAPKGLPQGMTAVLSGNTIGFTGTPTKAGTFNGSITIRDSANFQLTKKFTIKINPELTFTPPQQQLVYIPGKFYSQTFKTAGGTGARTVTYELSGPLPSGLTISPPSPTTGSITISGKTSVKTKVKITMTVTDSIGAQKTITYTLQSS